MTTPLPAPLKPQGQALFAVQSFGAFVIDEKSFAPQ
jgi:hypothetical protein